VWIEIVWNLMELLWENIMFWRVVSLILLLVFFGAWFCRRQLRSILLSPEKTEHDRRIFHESNDVMSEQDLGEIISLLINDCRYTTSQMYKLGGYLVFFNPSGNQFIYKDLRKRHREFIEKLGDLRDFLARNFFVEDIAPKCHWRGLYPALRHSGEPDKQRMFKEYMDQLHSLTPAILASYREYRKSVKSKLII